jgi:putative transposase
MIYHLLFCFVTLVLDVFASAGVAPTEKDLQIALLRQQLHILERKSKTKTRLSRPEKLILVTLATRLKAQTRRFHEVLGEALLLVQPDTVLKWHRQLVRRKWTFQHLHRGGRPRLIPEIELLIVRLARENLRMGYDKIQGGIVETGVQSPSEYYQERPAPSWFAAVSSARTQCMAHVSEALSPADVSA